MLRARHSKTVENILYLQNYIFKKKTVIKKHKLPYIAATWKCSKKSCSRNFSKVHRKTPFATKVLFKKKVAGKKD